MELVFTWEFIISVSFELDSIAEYEFQCVGGEVWLFAHKGERRSKWQRRYLFYPVTLKGWLR
jgi:hypothetical protein